MGFDTKGGFKQSRQECRETFAIPVVFGITQGPKVKTGHEIKVPRLLACHASVFHPIPTIELAS